MWNFLGKKSQIENGEMSQSSRQKEGGETHTATPTERNVWFGPPTAILSTTEDKKEEASIGRKKAATTAIKKIDGRGKKAKKTTPSPGRKSTAGGKEKRKSLSTNRTTPAKRKSSPHIKIGNLQGSASTMKKRATYGKNNGEKLTKAIFFRCEVNVNMV